MKLTRKSGATTLKNKQGLDIPNATVLPIRFLLDYKNKQMNIIYGLFADENALSNGYEPIEKGELFFNADTILPQYTNSSGVVYEYDGINYLYHSGDTSETSPAVGATVSLTQAEIDDLTLTDLGRKPFDEVLLTLQITSTEVKPVVQESKDWIMAQLDWTGTPFSTNWELDDGS